MHHSDDRGLQAAVDRGDWEAAAAVAERWGVELLYAPLGRQHAALIARIPIEVRLRRPILRHTAELFGEIPLDLDAPGPDLDRIEAGGESAFLELRRIASLAVARRLRGRPEEGAAVFETVLPAVDRLMERHLDLPRTTASWFYLQVGIGYETIGRFEAARRAYLSGWRHRYSDALGWSASYLASSLAALSALEGDSNEARQWIAAEASTAAEPVRGEANRIGVQLAEIIVALDRYDLAAAERGVAELPGPRDYQEHAHHVLWLRVQRFLAMHRPADALRVIDETHEAELTAIEANPWYRAFLAMVRIDALLAAGEFATARAELADRDPGGDWHLLLSARSSLLDDAPQAALVALDRIRERPVRRLRLSTQILRSAALLDLGQLEAATVEFRRFVAAAGDDRYALATVAERHVRGLFALLGTPVPAPPSVGEQWADLDRPPIYPFDERAITITDRERAILERLARRESRSAIAAAEFVSVNTVKTQISTLYRKFEVAGRDELVAKALSLGLLSSDA